MLRFSSSIFIMLVVVVIVVICLLISIKLQEEAEAVGNVVDVKDSGVIKQSGPLDMLTF